MRLRVGGCSDTGKVRSLNEDAYTCHRRLGLFVVCDGMGGEAAGEVASQLAVATILKQLDNAGSGGEKAAGEATGYLPRTRSLEAALQASNQVIYQESQQDAQRAGMGTAVVSAWIGGSVASLAHVGDSRAYLWRNQQLEQLTRDHSFVEEQIHLGLLSRSESLHSELQNILLRALGREPQVEVDLAEVPLMPGDYLLLCTDGLTRMVADATLAEAVATLREPQKICDHLVALANRNGGVDNITVVVIEVARESLWQRLWRGWRS